MPDKRMVELLGKTIENLSLRVSLLDGEGNAVIGRSVSLPAMDEHDDWAVIDGDTWMRLAIPGIQYVRVEGDTQSAADCAKLVAALAHSMCMEPPASDKLDVVRSALREELSGPELEALTQEYGIPMTMNRCAILFHGTSAAMRELIPLGEDDILVEMDRHVLVLVKSMDNMDGYEELSQLAEAMEQTIMSETGEQPSIAIGEMKATLAEMGQSYRAAWRALEIGRAYHPDKNLYSFTRLVLERFLSEINRELGARYHNMLFNRKTQRLFNDEMLHTIEMFFEKDLNLSDTARQLYIHRNTLVYRLDKIQRQTGLDLRRFEDAITFRMLLLLGKCGGDKPTAVR